MITLGVHLLWTHAGRMVCDTKEFVAGFHALTVDDVFFR